MREVSANCAEPAFYYYPRSSIDCGSGREVARSPRSLDITTLCLLPARRLRAPGPPYGVPIPSRPPLQGAPTKNHDGCNTENRTCCNKRYGEIVDPGPPWKKYFLKNRV
jgi:hypothetical protein